MFFEARLTMIFVLLGMGPFVNGHVLLKVTLANGDKYAVDLTGAQYGQYSAVLPAGQYYKEVVEAHVEYVVFGTEAEVYTQWLQGRAKLRPKFPELATIKHAMIRQLNHSVEEWEKSKSGRSRRSRASRTCWYRRSDDSSRARQIC